MNEDLFEQNYSIIFKGIGKYSNHAIFFSIEAWVFMFDICMLRPKSLEMIPYYSEGMTIHLKM